MFHVLNDVIYAMFTMCEIHYDLGHNVDWLIVNIDLTYLQ